MINITNNIDLTKKCHVNLNKKKGNGNIFSNKEWQTVKMILNLK